MRDVINGSKITICNMILMCLLTLIVISGVQTQTSAIEFNVIFGEGHDDIEGDMAQVFFSDNNGGYSEEKSVRVYVAWNQVNFHFPEMELSNTQIRLDPFMRAEEFSIDEVEVLYREKSILHLSEEEFLYYIQYTAGCEYSASDEKFLVWSDDPGIYFNSKFNERIEKACQSEDLKCNLAIALGVYLLFGILEIRLKKGKEKVRLTLGHFFTLILADVVVAAGIAMNYGVYYLKENFGEIPLGQLLYHLHTPLDGTNVSSFYGAFVIVGAIVIVVSVIIFLSDYLLRRKVNQLGDALFLSVFGAVMGAHALMVGYSHFDYKEYYKYTHENTELYDEYYVDGRDVDLTFPEEKRNLIYIFLESMETSYADENTGGIMDENYIAELTELALENICFSGDDGVLNGAHTVYGATFTMGAIVAQTAGVPINESLVGNDTLNSEWEAENSYLPGAWTIGDILREQGYNQTFMIGSDGSFSGRSSYFREHGNYKIFDYNTAVSEGMIPEDYYVWWGYEDEKLIAFAKDEILALAEQAEPFNFTMLTVDTHFTDGYVCDLCEDAYEAQYSNVIACSSRQIAEFVDWIKTQDFYENTTIVIAGDHLTMDSTYISEGDISYFDRKTYFTIINPAKGCSQSVSERDYTTMDIYPTTLASLGVQIEGDRLGLGVNLFSDVPALYEQYGEEYLNEEVLKNSDFYTKKLLYGD